MRQRQETDDTLMLLAHIAAGLGADMDDYQVPGERWADYLEEVQQWQPEERRLRVLAVAEAIGGEVG